MLVLQSIALQLGEAETPLLSSLSAWYPASHFGAILGPSGCGKSTLLKVIAGILPHTSGSIFWQGKDLENEDLPAHQLGYVPQFSCTQPRLSVQENLFYGARLRQKGTRQEIEARVEQVMEETGLQDLQDRRAGVLSGGQLRRLSLAMELTTRPSLLLADEVTSGLDPKSEEEITELLSSLAREQGRLVLLVTHSLRHMESYDSITVLTDGHLAYSADPRDLTDYFRVKSPELIFPTLATQSGQEWANRWNALPKPEGLTSENILGELESISIAEEKENSLQLPSLLSQATTWLSRRIKIFLRDPAQVFLQLSLLLVFPAVVTLFAYRGLPEVRNMAMSSDTGVVEQLRDSLSFTIQSSRVGTLVSGLAMFQVILLALMGSNNSAREVVGDRAILEKEKLAGLRPGAALIGMGIFLSFLVLAQAGWMTLFVRAVCQFPGGLEAQFMPFLLVTGSITALCLAISSWTSSSEQASLGSLYLVGFQLPLSGAILALPDFLGVITRPWISAYWAWSGYLQTLKDTRFYDLVKAITETPIASFGVSLWILLIHLLMGLVLAYFGMRRSQWR
ncbi:MAG: ATP-binding cassette domain-containing protein [Verrucomicrobia bacterium]|nr:ATP-binding cassette domain-containing protein [Verrucomicrobiota bacterium]